MRPRAGRDKQSPFKGIKIFLGRLRPAAAGPEAPRGWPTPRGPGCPEWAGVSAAEEDRRGVLDPLFQGLDHRRRVISIDESMIERR